MEMLIKPLDKITQGSIVDDVDFGMGDSNPLGIVLSNECDIINGKSSYIIIASLMPAADIILNSKEFMNKVEGCGEDGKLSKKKSERIKNFLDDYIFNKGITRYYFINPIPVIEVNPLFVDFQHIISIPYENISNLENIAQLKSPYCEQMIVHFASYTARIPVDRDDNTDELARSLIGPKYTLDI